jgi:hypothetical protein
MEKWGVRAIVDPNVLIRLSLCQYRVVVGTCSYPRRLLNLGQNQRLEAPDYSLLVSSFILCRRYANKDGDSHRNPLSFGAVAIRN